MREERVRNAETTPMETPEEILEKNIEEIRGHPSSASGKGHYVHAATSPSGDIAGTETVPGDGFAITPWALKLVVCAFYAL